MALRTICRSRRAVHSIPTSIANTLSTNVGSRVLFVVSKWSASSHRTTDKAESDYQLQTLNNFSVAQKR